MTSDVARHEALRFRCRICSTFCNRIFDCTERMFGTREVFQYAECPACGTLQLIDIPADLSPYYPSTYYSYSTPRPHDAGIKRAAKTARAAFIRHAPPALLKVLPSRFRPEWADWLSETVQSRHSLIVDIGAGSGHLVTALYSNGFTNVMGYDPFLSSDKMVGPVPLYRTLPADLAGTVKVAMMHHSLEHTTDPIVAVQSAAAMLDRDGYFILRIPLIDSYAWRHYGTDWIALDPPRHISLLTERAVDILAAAAGFDVIHHWRDSTNFQFWGSEQFRRGIVMLDERSVWHGLGPGRFTEAELQSFDQRTAELNREGDGDTGCFILRATSR